MLKACVSLGKSMIILMFLIGCTYQTVEKTLSVQPKIYTEDNFLSITTHLNLPQEYPSDSISFTDQLEIDSVISTKNGTLVLFKDKQASGLFSLAYYRKEQKAYPKLRSNLSFVEKSLIKIEDVSKQDGITHILILCEQNSTPAIGFKVVVSLLGDSLKISGYTLSYLSSVPGEYLQFTSQGDMSFNEDGGLITLKYYRKDWYLPDTGSEKGWTNTSALYELTYDSSVQKFVLYTYAHTALIPRFRIDGSLVWMQALDSYHVHPSCPNKLATRAYMENDVLQQQMDIIGATDPTAQADAYKKIFGDCCENPQVINQ